MLCPNCLGRHVVSARLGEQPCPECGGMGEIHCCDGLQVQCELGDIITCDRCEAFAESSNISSPH